MQSDYNICSKCVLSFGELQGSLAEVTSSLRSKIFSLFTITGFEGYEGLTGQDLVVLEKIKAYLTLKTGEIWSEIDYALRKDGIQPIETDVELLQAVHDGCVFHVDALRDKQLDVLARAKQTEMDSLDAHFEDVRERHVGAHDVSRKHTDFLHRTADYATLQRVRQQQYVILGFEKLVFLAQMINIFDKC